jgi:hypothetical protein
MKGFHSTLLSGEVREFGPPASSGEVSHGELEAGKVGDWVGLGLWSELPIVHPIAEQIWTNMNKCQMSQDEKMQYPDVSSIF